MMCSLCCLLPLAMLNAAERVEPLGDFGRRVDLVRGRMLAGGVPEFTPDFILADVALKPEYPRRFSEYSGDLSGRYIDAMACMPTDSTWAPLKALAEEAIAYQKPDGRFGSTALEFTPDAIRMEHMALLWGNGRLLVGLLEYHAAHPDAKVLAAACKLGDFLLSIHASCAREDVRDRVQDMNAAGMICFSQLVEPFALLAQATGETRYLEGAKKTVPWLIQERRKQHTHGYLTTVRGIMTLYAVTHDVQYLTLAEDLFNSLTHSGDNWVYGGVEEYFGGNCGRDEGCSEGDFVRLAVQLWKATGKAEYLERGERCLLNELYMNQFATGDFGHHACNRQGPVAPANPGRAWWCCTMHGLRTFRDVVDAIATEKDGEVHVNLFLDARWTNGPSALRISDSAGPVMKVAIENAPEAGMKLAIRQPTWAAPLEVTVNGISAPAETQDGYLVLAQPLKKGDQAAINIHYIAAL